MPVQATQRSRSPTRDSQHKSTRSPLACERCRSKKLRCVGGNPCNGCVRASATCDYGNGVKDREDQLGGVDVTVRVSQLERQVALLMEQVERMGSGVVDPLHANGSNQPHVVASEPTDCSSSIPQQLSPRSTARDAESSTRSQVRETPVHRLMQVVLPLRRLNAPFPPLMYHPAVWDNRSRSQTPEDGAENPRSPMGVTDFEAKAKLKDDPVNTGLVSDSMGQLLFDLFAAQCNRFCPVLHYMGSGPGCFARTRKSSSFLFCAILAIAAKYYRGYSARFLPPDAPRLDAQAPKALAQLAYSHLAASLFRKQLVLADIQAILLLACWNLQGGGMSPDPWVISGHAFRLAGRIGLETVSKQGTDLLASQEGADYFSDKTASLLDHWRTWLAWYIVLLPVYSSQSTPSSSRTKLFQSSYSGTRNNDSHDAFLCSGFGRPQMVPTVQLDEIAYLQLSQLHAAQGSGSVDPYSPAYLSSLVQLAKIARDLIAQASPALPNDVSPILMFYNARLDHWANMWGATSESSMGPYAKAALLYANHVRLCVNSISFATGGDVQIPGDATLWLQRGLDSALSVIKIYADIAEAESRMSFAPDIMTLILAQAGIFILRILFVNTSLPVDRDNLVDQLREVTRLYLDGDLSETQSSKHSVRVFIDMCRTAGVELDPMISHTLQTDPEIPDFSLDWLANQAPGDQPDTATDFNRLFGLPVLPDWADFGPQ